MMLISTAGAPGLQWQRAVNCCLWASETFPVSRGPSSTRAQGPSQREGGDTCPGSPAGRGSHPCHRGAREGASMSDGLFAKRVMGSRQVRGRKFQPGAGVTPSSRLHKLDAALVQDIKLRRLLILQGISQQVVQISSSLKSRLSSTLIRATLRKLEQGRFGG